MSKEIILNPQFFFLSAVLGVYFSIQQWAIVEHLLRFSEH
jgi:hypothetical protein